MNQKWGKKSRFWRNICPYSYESKVRQKSPEFDALYVPIVMNQKWGKKVQILTQIKAV